MNSDLTTAEVMGLATTAGRAGRCGFAEEHLGLTFAGLRAYCEEQNEAAVWQTVGRYLRDLTRQTAEGRGLILQGPTGTGKTGVLALLAEAECRRYGALEPITEAEVRYGNRRHHVLAINSAELADFLMNRRHEEDRWQDRFYALGHCAHLMIDDFGAEHMDAFGLNSFYKLMNDRYTGRRCTHLTINVDVRDYARSNANAGRIVSRLCQRCYTITLAGPDRRARLSAAALGEVEFGEEQENSGSWEEV